MTSTIKTALIAAVIAIAAIIAYVTLTPSEAPAVSGNTATSTLETVATSSQVAIAEAGMKVVQPAIDTPIKFSKNVTAEEKTLVNSKLEEIRAMLRADKYDFTAWVALGTTYKIGGDFQRALALWEYAGKAWPTNVVSFGNMGDLYANYLKDYPKAEMNYLQAIKNNATDSNAYRNLFTLYSETSYKPTNTAAEDLLKQYLVGEPTAYDMQVLLARYYVKVGKTTDAKAMFESAAKNAEQQNNASAAKDIRAEAAAL